MVELEGGEVKPVQLEKIDIYIEQAYSGNFATGQGKFSVVLEVIKNDQPVTREHFKGYKNTTKNRLPILACIEALKYIKKPCEIEIHIDSPYMAASIRLLDRWTKEGLDNHKNADLWKKYIELAEQHLISITQEKRNEYSPAMKIQLGVKEILMIEDYREENEF